MTENTLEKIVEAELAAFDEEFLKRPYEEGIVYASGDEIKAFIRTLSLTIAQATHDAVSVEEEKHEKHADKSSWCGYCGKNATIKEMHERFTRFLSGT
jgi:hypothetical protein